MKKPGGVKIGLQFLLLVGMVVILSLISVGIWGGKPEAIPADNELIFEGVLTIAEFGRQNGLPKPVLEEVFGLKTPEEFNKRIDEFKLPAAEISARINKAPARAEEHVRAMGTVKDAIALYGAQGVIFPPRLIALTLFLIMVLLANKFICSWGFHLGTLQDLIFRLNRKPKENNEGIMGQDR